MGPRSVHLLDYFAPTEWKNMQLHDLAQIMRQKYHDFAKKLNTIQTKTLSEGSAEDAVLHMHDLHVTEDSPEHPRNAMHV